MLTIASEFTEPFAEVALQDNVTFFVGIVAALVGLILFSISQYGPLKSPTAKSSDPTGLIAFLYQMGISFVLIAVGIIFILAGGSGEAPARLANEVGINRRQAVEIVKTVREDPSSTVTLVVSEHETLMFKLNPENKDVLDVFRTGDGLTVTK